MRYTVIYDGDCNLCSNLVQLLERIDRGNKFRYISMQDETLATYGITAADCEAGMILLDNENVNLRWQGADAAEEIGRSLPLGHLFVSAYRSLPGVKTLGDGVYAQVRDNRYDWFGRRVENYRSGYPACAKGCEDAK
jgi:predicted DCC family thiol-disulfide oxidoreductase YuxK